MKLSKTTILNALLFLLCIFVNYWIYFREDSAGGAIQDYNFHLGVRDFFRRYDLWT